MCGIFGMALARPLDGADLAAGRRAVASLAHRGPDGDGEWHDDAAGLYLGHRRLAVIDLDVRAAQPMSAHGLRITFNGEIYNYRALRDQLRGLGYRFTTESDTEVLLAGWRQWGARLLDHLDGMFAFALFDGRDIVLAVDPFGEKPMFLHQGADGCRFASEVRALQSTCRVRQDLDTPDLYAFLTLGYVPRMSAAFDAMERLAPGTFVVIRDGKLQRRTRYWQFPEYRALPGTPQPLSDRDIDAVRDALTRSIEARLVSDVPLALFLSSGVDSTLTALLCRFELGIRPQTLTMAFKGKLSGSVLVDESPAAERLAEYIGSDHSTHLLEPRALGYTIDDILDLFRFPIDNSGALAIKAICAVARRSVTVGLTGLGGDELSFGYGKTSTLYRLRSWYGLPWFLRRASGWMAGRAVPMWPKLQALAGRAAASPHQAYVAEKNFPAIAALNTLPGFRAWTDETFVAGREPFLACGCWDLTETMPNSILLAQDHASMSESLELRTPFLSRDLIRVMSSFDARSLVHFGRKNAFVRLRERYLKGFNIGGRSHGFLFSSDHLLRQYGDDVHPLRGVPRNFVDAIWRRRFQGEGWTRLALRLAILGRWQSRSFAAPAAPVAAPAIPYDA